MQKLFLFFLFVLLSHNLYAANQNKDYLLFKRIFSDWTAAFNRKDLSGSCNLFAKSLIADYQGFPQKNYFSICNGFKKIFSEKNRRYRYRFKLHQVYRSCDVAAARITWYLSVYENERLLSTTQDEGIDIFKKNSDNQWQIVNYLSYGKEIQQS